jgi:ABC-2 type transport system permease protein
MHPRAIWAIARKDAPDLLLNKSTLGGLLFPILLSLVWLLIINVVGNRTTDILVYNPGSSNVVQVVMAAFSSPEVTQAGSAGEVTAAFGSTATHKTTPYAVGLIVPADLDNSLRVGTHPQLQLYLDGKTVNAQTEALIQAAIVNYGRALANVQPPLDLTMTVINPPSETNAAVELRGGVCSARTAALVGRRHNLCPSTTD